MCSGLPKNQKKWKKIKSQEKKGVFEKKSGNKIYTCYLLKVCHYLKLHYPYVIFGKVLLSLFTFFKDLAKLKNKLLSFKCVLCILKSV